MKHQPTPNDDSWEHDPVWKLLDQSPHSAASPRFVDDTVRAARLAGRPLPWWKRLMAPAPIAGLAAASAAVVIAALSLWPDANPASAAQPNDFAEIQEIAESEILLTAADHLDAISDVELVSLIGF